MMRRLYAWTLKLSASPHALWALVAIAFAEGSFFPIPPDALLVPMTLARPTRAWEYAAWTTAASVLGGIAGYLIGALLYDSVGQWLIGLYGGGDDIEKFRAAYAQYGMWIILLKGVTPIPYKLVTVASGFAGYDFFAFVVLSIITRGFRFFLVAELLRRYGEPIRHFIEKRLYWVTAVSAAFIVGGFFAMRYI